MGFKADAGPLCDNCLLDWNMDLGMLLVMANVNREFANQPKPDDPSQGDPRKTALMTFSMMYDETATWPRRRRAFPECSTGSSQTVQTDTVCSRAQVGGRSTLIEIPEER